MELYNQPKHEEIWDDSALVDSWNQALKEYKKYHSIHAQGGAIEDILDSEKDSTAGRSAKPETKAACEPIEGDELLRYRKSDETRTGVQNETSQEAEKVQVDQTTYSPYHINLAPSMLLRNASRVLILGDLKSLGLGSQGGGVPVMAPQTLLGSVQDEDLKKLLMSWYYAGYYTGLYEGKQQAEQASKRPQ